jgi:extracellular elastinolytic metalloproteinase
MNLVPMFRVATRMTMSVAALGLASGASVFAASPEAEHYPHHYDVRISLNKTLELSPGPAQRQAIAGLAAVIPDLAVTFDSTTGVTRSVVNHMGYLTEARSGTPEQIALDFVRRNLPLLGLEAADLDGYEVTDSVFSRVSGATHIYLRQVHQGISVYNAQLQVNVNRDGRIISVNNAFVPGLGQAVAPVAPVVGAPRAVQSLVTHLGLGVAGAPRVIGTAKGVGSDTRLAFPELARSEIAARLMWLPMRRGDVRLVWNFQVEMLAGDHWYDVTVDARSGALLTRRDYIAEADYRVFPSPLETAAHAPIPPPADGRTVETDPDDASASPLAWHNNGTTAFTITRGNNVHAWEDSDGNDAPPATDVDCGAGLDCEFDAPIDFGTQAPSTYQDAAVANLFYWNNIIHDIQWQYGFDEPAGNFQVDTFGNGGVGGDDVQALAQSGLGNCNANFGTPVDGSRPRMRMFTCTNVSPARDGDFDHMVIVHEYGHGISNRLVGGPGNVSCLGNTQQAGEGLSDWWGLAHTMEVGDVGTEARGVGTYLFGQAPNGPGIRDLPYSTDNGVNNWTYESINGATVPHGVGSRWAQAYWDVTWALIDEHGFDPDFYAGTGGNNRAMFYINEGLKNTICSPAFTDIRDGIVQAATDNFGGEDVCTVWEAFADYGLGTDAVSGGPNSTSPTNGFAVPVSCLCDPGETVPVADAGLDQVACAAESVQIGTPALPGHTYLWSPGGATTAQITVSPTVTTEYTVTVTTDCGSEEDSVTVFIDPGIDGLSDDFEAGIGDWDISGLWHVATDTACTSPEPGYSSPLNSVYYGDEGSCDYDTGAQTIGDLISAPIFGVNASSQLTFDHFRQVESFGGGSYDIVQVDVIASGGTTTLFSLDSTNPSSSVWTAAGPFSLAAFDGQVIQLRFRFNSVDEQANAFVGWLVDDVEVTGMSKCGGGPPDIPFFYDGFESGDTSAWSSTTP